MLARRILGSGQTRGVSFRPFPNSSSWWRLISSVFLIRISCHETTHANGYYGAWPGWAVLINVLPLTQGPLFKKMIILFIYLAVPGLSCHIQTLSCDMWESSFLNRDPGMEPGSPALGVQSLSHWTTREVPGGLF